MSKISVSIIGHNEEENLPFLLESVRWADEIVYVDCESSDRSVEIVQRYNARIFRKDNNPNLNVNKQYAIDRCSSEWIIYLDPDEIVTNFLSEELRRVASCESGFDAYLIPRKNHFFGKYLKRGGKYPDHQLRFFKKGKAFFPCQHIHEKLSVDGKIGKLKGHIVHYCLNSAGDALKKMDFYSDRKLDFTVAAGRQPSLFKAARRFAVNYFFKLGFLDGKLGFAVAVYDFFTDIMTYFKYLAARTQARNSGS